MKDPFKEHGAFSWFELMTTDTEGAKEFYSKLFGWETEEMPMEDMNYTVLKVGDDAVGGIMPIPPHAEGTPPNWGGYVTVDDVDATARKAEELGARTLVPLTDIPNVGRFFVLQDPQGAVISAITYAEMND
jgi:predicted enzyme related to lactoylglutathione lyase